MTATATGFSVPIVDISATLTAGRPVGDVCERIDRACCDVGFFAIVGHSIDDGLRADLLSLARRFFDLPDSEKRALGIERSPNNRGYAGIAGERLQPDLPADLKETFDVGLELAADGGELSPLDGPNQWPPIVGFRATVERYQDEAIAIARTLMSLIAVANHLPDDHFTACLRRPIVTTRLLRYPRVDGPTAGGQLGCGAHSDYGCLTLLYADGTPGLQLMTVDDEWVDVAVPEGALIVNLGDLLQRWTNDRYRSTRHRVIPPTERDRYSVPVFVNPEWSTLVRCLPTCTSDERPARHAPVVSGEYLQSRYDDTFVYRADTPALDSRNVDHPETEPSCQPT